MHHHDLALDVQKRAAQSVIFVDNATTVALVKPCGRALVNNSSHARNTRIVRRGFRFVLSIFDRKPLADFVDAPVECVEPRVNRAVVEI